MPKKIGHDELVRRAHENGFGADLAHYDSNPVRKKLKPNIQAQYDRVLEVWEAFTTTLPAGQEHRATPCDMQHLKLFARFLGLTVKGCIQRRLDKTNANADTTSLRAMMRRFCNSWERKNNRRIPQDNKLSMAPFIEGQLADELGLYRAGKIDNGGKKHKKVPKPILTIENYVRMQDHHWIRDGHQYQNEGNRVDNTNLLNTHCFTSARLSEVCQAVYNDLECILSWNGEKPEFTLKFTREQCKGRDENQPEHSFGEQIVGPEGVPPPLFAQPMLHWLANIISSQAFADYQTVEEALAARPPRDSGSYRVMRWAEGKKHEPVFPRWTANGRGTKPRTPTSWANQAHDWARRAGFSTEIFGMHAARRAALINVNNKYSLGEVLRFASQNNIHVLANHYLSNVSTVDGAATYLGMQPRTDLAEGFRSATMRLNPGLSQTLPAEEEEKLRKSQEFVSLEAGIVRINETIQQTAPEEARAELKSQRTSLYANLRKLRRRRLAEYQGRQELRYETAEDHEQADWRQGHFDRIRHVLHPARRRLARTLQFTALPRSEEWVSALKDLVELRNSDCSVAYQDSMRPVDGKCPVKSCSLAMTSITGNPWKHVFDCYRKFHRENSGFAHFCFHCSKWFTSELDAVSDCQAHIEKDDIPFRCNPVTFCKAIACAGYCPVHLGWTDLPADKRMTQYPDQTAWQRHISQCIPQYIEKHDANSLPCPHPLCPVLCPSVRDLWHHLQDVHSVAEPAAFGKRKADPADDQDVEHLPEIKKRCIAIKFSQGRKKVPKNLPEAASSPGSACSLSLSPVQDIPEIAEVALSISSSDFSYAGGDKRERPSCSTTSTPLSSPLDPGDMVGFGGDRRSPWSTRRDGASEECFSLVDPIILYTPFDSTAVSSLLDPALRTNTPAPESSQNTANEPLPEGCKRQHSTITPATSEPETDQPSLAGEDEYEVESLLDKWRGWFFVKWVGGTCTWEPKENILDDNLIEDLEKRHDGLGLGVEIVGTRRRGRKVEYRVHFSGRPSKEDEWIAERYLNHALIQQHRPSKKGKRGKRR